MTLKKYTISLDGLLSHENIIFKMICSVSERSKNRTSSYTLTTDLENANICINDIKNRSTDDIVSAKHINVWVSDNKDEAKNTIARPLIATRVLNTLDLLIDNIKPEIHNTEINNTLPITESKLSEEETSELAIVHDEILENPANKEDSTVSNPELTLIKNEKNILLSTGHLHHVLVVDDSQSVRKQLELELDLFDVTVDFADCAKSAFELLESNKYDLALLDVVLPDKDGFLICKHIKATNRETIAIMLTGKASQADKIKGSLAGCNDYLIKPVGRVTFQNAVKRYISLKEENTAIEA